MSRRCLGLQVRDSLGQSVLLASSMKVRLYTKVTSMPSIPPTIRIAVLRPKMRSQARTLLYVCSYL